MAGMTKSDIWSVVHSERKALISDLDQLSEDQWSTQSLCTGWTVRQVLGHMVATARMTPGKFFPKLVGSGFRFESMVAKDVAAETAGSPEDTRGSFRSLAEATNKPPGPAETVLGETIVHSTDIRRPLGIQHQFPPEALAAVGDFYRRSNLIIGGKKRAAGLSMTATDTSWSAGDGPAVSGPNLSLVMAIAGRKAAMEDLSGEGVGILSSRM